MQQQIIGYGAAFALDWYGQTKIAWIGLRQLDVPLVQRDAKFWCSPPLVGKFRFHYGMSAENSQFSVKETGISSHLAIPRRCCDPGQDHRLQAPGTACYIRRVKDRQCKTTIQQATGRIAVEHPHTNGMALV